MPLVKAYGSRIVLVDLERDPLRRAPLRFVQQNERGSTAPIEWSDRKLIEQPVSRIDCRETRHSAAGDVEDAHDLSSAGLQRRQMLDDPSAPPLEIDGGHGASPAENPEIHELRKMGRHEIMKPIGRARHARNLLRRVAKETPWRFAWRGRCGCRSGVTNRTRGSLSGMLLNDLMVVVMIVAMSVSLVCGRMLLLAVM